MMQIAAGKADRLPDMQMMMATCRSDMTRNHNENRALNTMRNRTAQGWTDEGLLVDTAAQVLGGDDAAKLTAQRVFDRHFKIMGAN